MMRDLNNFPHFRNGNRESVGPGSKNKDLFLFRAALNADEVAALHEGRMLAASLEIYSPLADAEFKANSVVENRAQSLTGLKVGSDRIAHTDESPNTN